MVTQMRPNRMRRCKPPLAFLALVLLLSLLMAPVKLQALSPTEFRAKPATVLDPDKSLPPEQRDALQSLAELIANRWDCRLLMELVNFDADETKIDAEIERISDEAGLRQGDIKSSLVIVLDGEIFLRMAAYGEPDSRLGDADVERAFDDVNANYDHLQAGQLPFQVLYSVDKILAEAKGGAALPNPFALAAGATDAPATTESGPPTSVAVSPEPRELLPKGEGMKGQVALTPSGRPTLIDDDNLLSPDEQRSLSQKALAVGKKYGLDVVLAINSANTGQSARFNAADLYDYSGYGPDGVLGLIDLANREIFVLTTGTAMKILPNDRAHSIEESAAATMKARTDSYYGAMKVLLDKIEDKLADSRPRLKLLDMAIALGAALIVFLIFYFGAAAAYRRPQHVKRQINLNTQAITNYEQIEDRLIDRKTSSHTISSASSGGGSGGGGGSFTGSSGVSHGGGGGAKF